MKFRSFVGRMALVLCALLSPVRAADNLLITEFMAVNDRTLPDEDGDYSDWIEIHNAGTNAVNLYGWSLTDKAADLAQWSFPATNLAPNGYLVVFASGKNRRVPGATLHTSFSLKSGGEYLALVRPGGTNVVSAFAPLYPPQAGGLSYGFPAQQTVTTLLATGAVGRVFIPANTNLGFTWTAKSFNDNSWSQARTGVGYDTETNISVVADSVADWSFSGVQGEKNWFYGYYNESSNTITPTYFRTNFVAFPRATGPHTTNNFWDGDTWDWTSGDPPFDEIGPLSMLANGLNHGNRHWVIRRWISEVSGTITVDWELGKPIDDGTGVTARILQNGVLRDTVTLSAYSPDPSVRSVVITGVNVGDAIDVALDPTGTGGTYDDIGDASYLSATIRGNQSLTPNILTNITSVMRNINSSAYLRLPFVVTNVAAVEFLTLRMKFDDGFLAYLNGQLVASANAPASPAWNSTSTVARADVDGGDWQEFNLTAVRGLLQVGTNVLAIHGLNTSASDGDFLLLPELLATSVTLNTNTPRYFSTVTPGAANGLGTTNLGPLILQADHTPNVPQDSETMTVTAEVRPTFASVATVSLIYRVMYGSEVMVTMFDDGAHGDGAAGDGVFGAVIPASASSPGQMVRFYIFATDTLGRSGRFPGFDDSINSPEYLGTVVPDSSLTNPLPVLHMFVQNPVLATNDAGTRCSIFYDGEFYDNVFVNLHGQTTASVFSKKSMSIDLNTGHKFRWSRDQPRVNDFNLLTTMADKAYLRLPLAYETFTQAGVPSHFAFPVRIQQNGAFFGVFSLVEQGDANFLDRVGLDPKGALYKAYYPLTGAYGVSEKKTRQDEPNDDLQALIDNCKLTGPALRNYLYDNIDIPELINYLATIQLVQNEDCCDYKNYYLYRDSDGTGEWQMLPWDLDLTFGRTFSGFNLGGQPVNGYFNTNIYFINRYYSQSRATRDFIGQGHPLVNALFATTNTLQMFYRRWSRVQEQFLQVSNTHPLLLRYERRVDELAAQIAPDAVLDLAKWGTWFPSQTLPVAVGVLKTNYFRPRRDWIFRTLVFGSGGPYVGPQPSNTVINIAALEFNPSSGNQAEEYIQLFNPNAYAVDISGWKLSGAVDFTFRGGTVIPTNSSLYVTPDVKAFRARTTGPRGGQGLFVVGGYKGQLSARGEALQLTDETGRLVRATNYTGSPSLAQQYLRVTEIMYHPAPAPPGLLTNAEEFEFIEVKNIGPVALNLDGVHFTNGVDFNFTGSAVTNLAPGQSAVLVRNLAAFLSRYGTNLNVAGVFFGALDNMGEQIRLEDTAGEVVLDFDYNNTWYPITDGLGFALAIVDENAAWDSWGMKSSWRPSGAVGGSPGLTNPAPPSVPGILINEALTHTDLPAVDAIELFNPTGTNVNLGGWFLSDDFGTPKKFRIYDNTIIPSGGYLVFTEANFNTNPASPTSFSLSSKGDEVYLFSADLNGNLTGWFHGFAFGAAENGVTFGRHVTSVGEEHFKAQSATSLNASNAGPKVGPVVISEIHYHPGDYAGGVDNSDDEFIELQNITGGPVNLFHAAFSTNTWHLRGGVDFDFATNVSLAANSFALLVNFNPTNGTQSAAFRAKFGVPVGVSLFGPYRGQLDNSSASVKLLKPDAPETNTVPYILVDEVGYADSTPWPSGADGTGATLQRLVASQYGNDPTNWFAAAPTAGQSATNGTAPVITTQPSDQIVYATASVAFTVAASGTAPFRYQWNFNGTNLPLATNATLVLNSALPDNVGRYGAVVFNAAGVAFSSNASLTLVYGPTFTLQPQSTNVLPNTSVTFSGLAVAATPLRYQWRLNGANILNATNTTYTIASVQSSQSGSYQLVASDNLVSVPSAVATLTVASDLVITQQPQNLNIASGGTGLLSVGVTGTMPINFQWRRNTLDLAGETNATLVVSNFGTYAVRVSNPFTNVVSSNASVSVFNPPVITLQPVGATNVPGADATFTVSATGNAPLRYQWLFNTTNLVSGATNASFTLTNIQPPHSGAYTVRITNIVGNVTSTVARLSVLVPPLFVLHPLGQAVVAGGSVTLSVTITNTATLPATFGWMRDGAVVVNGAFALNDFTRFLTVTNIQTPAEFIVGVTNDAQPGGVMSNPAQITVLADSDGDGLPDVWEQAYGLNSTNAADALLDADGDGSLNWQEYVAGTNPTNALSFLKVEVLNSGPGATLSFGTISNRTYALEYRDVLGSGTWTRLAEFPARPTNRIEVVPDPAAPTNRFYRVATPRQP